MAKTNKGLTKLLAINARAKKIREAGGYTTVTVKKYKIKQKSAIKEAASQLKGGSGVKAHKRIRRRK
jgi:hypothetical protein